MYESLGEGGGGGYRIVYGDWKCFDSIQLPYGHSIFAIGVELPNLMVISRRGFYLNVVHKVALLGALIATLSKDA